MVKKKKTLFRILFCIDVQMEEKKLVKNRIPKIFFYCLAQFDKTVHYIFVILSLCIGLFSFSFYIHFFIYIYNFFFCRELELSQFFFSFVTRSRIWTEVLKKENRKKHKRGGRESLGLSHKRDGRKIQFAFLYLAEKRGAEGLSQRFKRKKKLEFFTFLLFFLIVIISLTFPFRF